MHISLKLEMTEFVSSLSSYFLTENFFRKLKEDSDTDERYIEHVDGFYLIQSAASPIPSYHTLPSTLFLMQTDTFGGLEIFHISTEINRSGVLYWIIKSNLLHTVSTRQGIVSFQSSQYKKNPVSLYSRMDSMWIGGNAGVTILALDAGSSHIVT